MKKRDALREMGVDPYGGRVDGVMPCAEVRAAAEPLNIADGERSDLRARVAGRIALLRVMGKLAFLTIDDRTGRIQLGLSKQEIGDQWPMVRQLDLGDIISVEGVVGKTKTGELTVWASSVTVLTKALRPPPEKWHGLTDVELRYRQRYVDLFANPEVRDVFRQRSEIIQAVRQYLLDCGYLEVETPALQPIYGGAAARPFTTHHNTLNMDLFLRISPELYLKRLLVGGMERVFEVCRNFRNEGISTKHNPEFTMIELYEAYADYRVMMERVEGMFAAAIERAGILAAIERRRGELEETYQTKGTAESAAAAGGGDRPAHSAKAWAAEVRLKEHRACVELIRQGRMAVVFGHDVLDFTPPWRRARYADLLREYNDIEMSDHAAVLAKAESLEIPTKLKDGSPVDHDVLVNAIFEATVEYHLVQPTFVYDYPAAICPLTRRHPENPSIALRFEAFVAGMEIGNAYTELNDPQVQEENLRRQVAGEGDETMAVMDEDFITALEYGMPPAGGLGVGIDRMAMLLTNSKSIRDVILFPLQRRGG
ncbi:MAG: lysine--tRNA ligase [Phycisphaerales bacterium]|nr:MAG: lysine--tRNA ligase [Phycisphaerales bacterium]